jgi:rare lipoprotein A
MAPFLLATLVVVGITAACSGSDPATTPSGEVRLPDDRGTASYYADKFVGRQTASGEVYDPEAMTAAHRSLPFGTKVRVTRVETGASVVVRINDRGPFQRGRIIDLSKCAARQLDMIQAGVVEVRLELVEAASSSASPDGRTSRGW